MPRPGDTLPPARGSATSISAAVLSTAPPLPACQARLEKASSNGVVAIAEQPERRFAAGAAHTWTRSPCLDSAARPCRVQHRRSPPALVITLASARGLLATRRNLKKQRTSTGHAYAASARGRTRTRGARSSRARPTMAGVPPIASAPGITALETTLASGTGGVPTRPHASEEKHSQCFASVSQCAGAQTLMSARFALPWNRHD